jgi:hypothetical protein
MKFVFFKLDVLRCTECCKRLGPLQCKWDRGVWLLNSKKTCVIASHQNG